jgi:FAD/FMN-containing dehydrogenase
MGDDTTMTTALDALRGAVAGPVLTPGDSAYADEVAGSDLAVVHTPPIVVGASSAEDVAATVRVAAASGLPLAVIGSGHADIPVISEGILLALRRLDAVEVDAVGRTATVGVGATWHDVLAQSTPHGLAGLCGSAPAVGVGGFLLGGGLGPIGRTFGFSSDHVRSFDVVGADGALRTVAADREPDLFWALRGGKGGLGVVTAATIDLLDLPTIYGGGQYYAAQDIAGLLRAYQGFVGAKVPEALTTSLAILRMPDAPALPPPLRGQTVAQLRVGYVGGGDGGPAEAERLLAPLRAAVGAPVFGTVGVLPYADIGTIHNDPTAASGHSTAGMLLRDLAPETVEALLAAAGPEVASPLALVEIRHLGGAFARVGSPPDAVSGRDAPFHVWLSSAPLPAPVDAAALAAGAAAVRGVLDALAPWSLGRVQINFCGSANTAAEAAAAWPPEIADRLAEIRRRYDPDGLFAYVPGAVRA